MSAFEISEVTTGAISALRIHSVLYLERSEFYLSRKQYHISKEFHELSDTCCEKIHGILLDRVVEKHRKVFNELMAMPAEMYEDCPTLGSTITHFAVDWGKGKGDFHEAIWELEDEINICIEVLEEGE